MLIFHHPCWSKEPGSTYLEKKNGCLTWYLVSCMPCYCISSLDSSFHSFMWRWPSHFFVFFVGSLCNCILPEALKSTTVCHDPDFQEDDNEKKKLRSVFSCLSSISMHQKEVSMPSLFLHSHYKGCLPPWDLKRSRTGSLKEQWEDIISFLLSAVGDWMSNIELLEVSVFLLIWIRKAFRVQRVKSVRLLLWK